MDSMIRYVSPVNPAVSLKSMNRAFNHFSGRLTGECFLFQIYPHLAAVLLIIGTSLAAWFFVFEVSRNKGQKESIIFKELTISFLSSIFLGFGILFGFLTSGIYV